MTEALRLTLISVASQKENENKTMLYWKREFVFPLEHGSLNYSLLFVSLDFHDDWIFPTMPIIHLISDWLLLIHILV